ncbi:hypothetical protein JTE90_003778 [Oedothorax gibbosus]|uniref:Kelch domain-containing protein 3 n=1 Tax=Oedothorax gibbosus TaxID=931172 RepID=A0AAV6VCA2_9ARAC|nr:hypothetical protein JTE90_003778 [Oedothorax gibbosus]
MNKMKIYFFINIILKSKPSCVKLVLKKISVHSRISFRADMYWIQHLDNGLRRVNHAAVTIGNLIYSFGGYCSENDLSEFMDVCIFNTDSLNWYNIHYSPTGDIPPSLFGHSAVVYKNKVYIWGGISSHHQNLVSEKLYCFDVASLTWSVIEGTGHVPSPTDGHSACVIDNSMYVFGGFESISEVLVNSLYKLDLDTYKWERLWTKGTPPCPRDFHTASVIGRRMYIFGGRSYIDESAADEIYYNEIMYIDVDSLTWVKPLIISEEPRGRRSHSAAVYNGEIYVIGGCCPDYYAGVRHLNDVYKFNAESNFWTELNIKGDGPNPRRRHCSVVIGDRLFLFGGSSPKTLNLLVIDTPLTDTRLIEESDLFIMDLRPTLRRLCQLKVIEYGLENHFIPTRLKDELQHLKKSEAPIFDSPQQIVP